MVSRRGASIAGSTGRTGSQPWGSRTVCRHPCSRTVTCDSGGLFLSLLGNVLRIANGVCAAIVRGSCRFCLDPPLKGVPRGKFICPTCTAAQQHQLVMVSNSVDVLGAFGTRGHHFHVHGWVLCGVRGLGCSTWNHNGARSCCAVGVPIVGART